jgi:hypothetical protein
MAEVAPRRPAAAWAVTVEMPAHADLGTVDALARLQLAVARNGGHIRVHGADADFRRLLGLAGLAAVIECANGKSCRDG